MRQSLSHELSLTYGNAPPIFGPVTRDSPFEYRAKGPESFGWTLPRIEVSRVKSGIEDNYVPC
jgi:hypothetical protein